MKRVTIRQRVRDLFVGGFVGTPDEAATRLREKILNIRPRCSELLAARVIERLPDVRRRSEGGGTAAVLRKVERKR